MRFENRIALLTAAAGVGIGQATARALAAEGATVVLTDKHEERTMAAADALAKELGAEVVGMSLDVTDEARVGAVVEEVIDRFGRIDILVNNSGINELAPIPEMSTENWRRVLDICLTGHFFLTRAVLPSMYERNAGTIVNVSSVVGWMAGTDTEAHYVAAKAGVMGLTRSTAIEAAPHKVRVNAVAPGLTWNEFLARIYPPEFHDEVVAITPLGRAGKPEDIANAIAFLASDQASFITGEVLNVSGGSYLRA